MSVMSVQHLSIGFWLKWILTVVAFPIGGAAAIAVAKSLVGPVNGVIGGVIAGAIIGAAQWLVLRQAIGVGASWIAATGGGLALGLAVAVGLLGTETVGGPLVIRGAVAGAVVGFMQWLILRHYASMAWVWVLAVTLFWAVGWIVTRAAGIDLSRGFYVFGLSGAAVYVALTGIVLIWLLRHPVPKM